MSGNLQSLPRLLARLASAYWLSATDRLYGQRPCSSGLAGAGLELIAAVICCVGIWAAPLAPAIAFGFLLPVALGACLYILADSCKLRLGESKLKARLALREAKLDAELSS